MSSRRDRFANAIALAVIAIGVAVMPTSGDIISATFQSATQFNYHVIHMPDFDQVRAGLGGSGYCHCAPASMMNLLAYAANHGFPELPPGPAHWQLQENFAAATGMIWLMGHPSMMNTQYSGSNPGLCSSHTCCNDPPKCGTSGSCWTRGMTKWLSSFPELVPNQHLAGGFSFNLESIAHALIQGGGRLGTVSYGYYHVIGFDTSFNIPIVQRCGGHVVSVVKVQRDPSKHSALEGVIWVRDPGDNFNPNVQSLFTNRIMQVSTVMALNMSCPDDGSAPQALGIIILPALDHDPSASVYLMLDGIRTIGTAAGYSWQNTTPIIKIHQPNQFTGHPHNSVVEHEIPGIPGILALELHPQTGEIFYINAGSEVAPILLYRFDPLTGETASVPTPSPVAPGALTIGRDGVVYIICCTVGGGCDLCGIDSTGQLVAQINTVPLMPHIYTYDDLRDRVVSSAAGDHALVVIDPHAPPGLPHMEIIDLPSSVPPLSAAVGMAVHPIDGRAVAAYWDGGISILDISDPANPSVEQHQIPGLTGVESIAFDSQGNLLISANGTTHAYVFGDWSTSFSEHPFHGLQVQGQFSMERGRSNFDPDLHLGPEWNEIEAEDLILIGEVVPDCLGDLAAPFGSVGVPDLLQLLSAWGPCDDPTNCPEDISPIPGGDGNVGVPDLLQLLQNWGSCPGFE